MAVMAPTLTQPLQIMSPSYQVADATLVSKPYRAGNSGGGPGRLSLLEDDGSASYETAPHIGEYEATRQGRGDHFMGCPRQEMLGCTDTLAQDNPFGDYLYRPTE
jgi:hypothetical protein